MTTRVVERRGRGLRLFTCALAAAAASGTATLEASGRMAATIVSCGDVITTSITVGNDLACTGDGLVVGAPSITINLNGHTLTGDDGFTDDGIDNTAGFDKVSILNGRIIDFGDGIDIQGGDRNQVVNVEVRSNSDDGLQIGANQVLVSNSRSVANGTYGMLINGNGNRIDSNRVAGNAGEGIYLIWTAASQVTRNTSSLNDTGIALSGSSNNTIQANIVTRNTDDGIRVSDDTSDGNRITANRAAANGDAGIDFQGGDSNVVASNSVSGNGTTGIVLRFNSDANALRQNDAIGNDADGVMVEATSDTTLVDGNTLSGNGDDGLDVDEPGATTTIKKNRADANADRGIEAVSAVDGGGNKAGANLGADCEVVACA